MISDIADDEFHTFRDNSDQPFVDHSLFPPGSAFFNAGEIRDRLDGTELRFRVERVQPRIQALHRFERWAEVAFFNVKPVDQAIGSGKTTDRKSVV